MWLERFIRTSQENVGSTEVRGGKTTFGTMHLKMTDYKLMGNFSVRTDHEIGARRPDLIIIEKNNKRCKTINTAILQDGRTRNKMWGVRTKPVPVVVGALGSIPLRLTINLRTIEVGIPIELIWRYALLGSAKYGANRKRFWLVPLWQWGRG